MTAKPFHFVAVGFEVGACGDDIDIVAVCDSVADGLKVFLKRFQVVEEIALMLEAFKGVGRAVKIGNSSVHVDVDRERCVGHGFKFLSYTSIILFAARV